MGRLIDGRINFSLGPLFLLTALAVGVVGFGYLQWVEKQGSVKVWVPKHDLSAYSQIKATDLTEKTFPATSIPSGVVKGGDAIIDRYTLLAVAKEKPLTRKELGPKLSATKKKMLQDAALVGIPATPAMTLGGNLQAGDVVDLILVADTTKTDHPRPAISFPDILIVDIIKSAGSASTTSLLLVALPLSRQQEYASQSPGSTVVVTKKTFN